MERNIVTEETTWENVQNAELKSLSQRKLGKWQDAQTSKANECSLKSGSTHVPSAATLSAKY